MLQIHKIILVTLFFSSFTACHLITQKAHTAALSPSISSIELFLSRASFSGTEYEQYKLEGTQIFYECGKIKNSRLLAEEQEVKAFKDKGWDTVVGLTKEALAAYDSADSLDTPGKANSFIDPGQFFLTVLAHDNSHEIKTSLDSVSAADSGVERALKGLAQDIRATTNKKICANLKFFGL